jgi:hypothetical protein
MLIYSPHTCGNFGDRVDIQITNHQIAAFSLPGNPGWKFLTHPLVNATMPAQRLKKTPNKKGTEYSFAR